MAVKRVFACLNGVIILFGMILLLGAKFHFQAGDEREVEQILKWLRSSDSFSVAQDGSAASGARVPLVTIVEFSDFQCPYCKKMAWSLKTAMMNYKDRVRLVFKHYPLDRKCNPFVRRTIHTQACDLAKAGICAQQQGRFWELHDLLFGERFEKDRPLQGVAEILGLDVERFEKCMESEEAERLLRIDIDDGRRLKIRGTPVLLINGRVLPGYRRPRVLNMVLENLLQSGF